MKKILGVIIGLTVAAALAGCNAESAETSISAPTASFDPSIFETSETSQAVKPYTSDFTLPTDGDPFSTEELLELSKKHFQSIWGFLPTFEIVYENDQSIYIHIYDYYTYGDEDSIDITTYEVYFIDKKSGTGQTNNGDFIDLTAYI